MVEKQFKGVMRAIAALAVLLTMLAGAGQAATIGPIGFDASADLSSNFYQFPSYTFAFSSGMGAGGTPGRVSMTGNKLGSSAVYDTEPNDTWGPHNEMKNVTIEVDFAFTDDVFASTETSSWQKFGISFNVDQNRESIGFSPDSLILYFENASHLDGGSDNMYLSRGSARDCDF